MSEELYVAEGEIARLEEKVAELEDDLTRARGWGDHELRERGKLLGDYEKLAIAYKQRGERMEEMLEELRLHGKSYLFDDWFDENGEPK